MKLGTPRWWYVRDGAPAPVIRALLRPASWIWAAVTANKIANASPVDPGVPVICIGNLTVGGAGKTPVVREVLARMRARGVQAHGLSRGYGGRELGPLQVDLLRHTAADVGDEPLMLAAEKGNLPLVKALLKAGAATDAKDQDGKLATDYAEGKTLAALIAAAAPVNPESSAALRSRSSPG
jgi:tetraacyldisaccharide-1-P 4'-kinase